ncbi:MAG: 50S ribosomal protein L24 [Candidatus Omnitrophica bacterium]|nr:50S ribosomal protein L24 [Candidatus Omnitrophota bacterium]
MLKIKKGDLVLVRKGKDKGKKGKVLQIIRDKSKALVEGINLVKKHRRITRQDQQTGIITVEAPISIANLMVVCKGCNRPTRVGFVINKDGIKQRICKKCKGVF